MVLLSFNPFRTMRLMYAEIRGVEGGSFLSIRDQSGRVVTVWSIQGRLEDVRRGRPSFADEVAELIRERTTLPSTDRPTADELLRRRRRVKARGLLVTLALAGLFVLRDVVAR